MGAINEISSKREERNLLPFEIKETEYKLVSLIVPHRDEPLNLERFGIHPLERKQEKTGFC